MFFGREDQLSQLEALWGKSVSSFVTCRGRRRVGKSTLIGEFARRSAAPAAAECRGFTARWGRGSLG